MIIQNQGNANSWDSDIFLDWHLTQILETQLLVIVEIYF